MRPLGKIVTVGAAVAMCTSLLTGVTTAYMLRSPSPVQSMAASYATIPVRRTPTVVAAHVVPAVARTTANTPRAVPVASTSSQCTTGSDRAWRIAKPGAIGGLVGAGLGATGGGRSSPSPSASRP
jgi:hypothetical protein